MSGTPEQKVRLSVPKLSVRARLDKWLADNPSVSLSRTRIKKLIDDGLVLVDGRSQAAKHLLVGGESIDLVVAAEPSRTLTGEDILLNVVFEDEYLLIVNKPAGMVTHPAPGNYSGTLVNALVYRFDSLAGSSESDRPGIVHRLDKNTSGLLVVAKTDSVYASLQQKIQERSLKRQYLGLIWGHMSPGNGTIDLPIGRSPRDRKKMAVAGAASREAQTRYRQLERYRTFQLLELSLMTGRTHQIRVHLSHLGHPVFGDPQYGGRDKRLRGIFAPERPLAKRLLNLISRQALHAIRLTFEHPVTGDNVSCEAPVPDDMQDVLDLLDREGK